MKRFTCRGIEECRNRRCVVNEICSKYDSRLTDEEANELYKLIESMHEKGSNEILKSKKGEESVSSQG